MGKWKWGAVKLLVLIVGLSQFTACSPSALIEDLATGSEAKAEAAAKAEATAEAAEIAEAGEKSNTDFVKDTVAELLYFFLQFKDTEKFQVFGLSDDGYGQWSNMLATVQAASVMFGDSVEQQDVRDAPGVLRKIVVDYRENGETQYTRTTIPKLKKAVGYEAWLLDNNK